MLDVQLSNKATMTGNYNGVPTAAESEAVVTLLVGGLTIVKSADKDVWAGGTGSMTYTVLITNDAENPYTDPVFSDTLDVSAITLVADSVKIDDATAPYDYNETTGLLTVELEDIAVGGSVSITFQVQQK